MKMATVENLSDDPQRKFGIVVFCLLILGITGIIAYKSVFKSEEKKAAQAQSSYELIKRLDKSMTSIKEKRDVILSGTELKDIYISSELYVSGILWNVEQPFAIINKEIVRVGDKIEDFQVIEIGKKSIKLQDKHGNETVKFLYEEYEEEVPTP